MIVAETARVRLRYFEERDFEDEIAYLNDWDVNGPLVVPPFPFEHKDAVKFYAKMKQAYEAGRPEFFVVAARETDRLMGAIGIHGEHTLAARDHVGEVGYWLGKPFWGQGFMCEAMVPMIDYAFARLGYTHLVATTNTDNVPSQKFLKKMGFDYLGLQTPLKRGTRGTEQVTSWQLSAVRHAQRKKYA